MIMATNRIVAPLPIDHWARISPKADFGTAAVAFMLALILGLSAVDLQRQRTLDPGPSVQTGSSQTIIDGRGKWGGLF
jgi:hypothetical protein